MMSAALVAVAGEAVVKVERAVVPLTHEAVARAYPTNFGWGVVVGNPAAPETNRWADLFFRYHFTVNNGRAKAATVHVSAVRPGNFKLATDFRVEPEKLDVAPGQSSNVTLVVKVPGEEAAKLPRGYHRDIEVRFDGKGIEGGAQKVVFWVPAVAKILAGSDGKGIPADVLPAGADYADEFSGGWDGTHFKQPFFVLTGPQIEARRKMVAAGLKPLQNIDYPFPRGDLGANLDLLSTNMITDARFDLDPERLGDGIFDVALRWAYTGDRKFADKIHDLLMTMVARADRLGRAQQKGRLGVNGLTEGWLTTPVFFAFDLIAGSGAFSPEEEARFKDWMVFEAGVMRPQIFAYSNQQCEENIAIFAAGLVAGDFDSVRFAYYPPFGAQGQLSGAFYADGFHREHQIGYHHRSIIPICEQAEALLRLGFCAYDERTHLALIQPVRATMGVGDDLGGNDMHACALAWLRYRDPLAADWLRLQRNWDRLDLQHGGTPLPPASGAYWKSGGSHLPSSGETVLRSLDGNRSVAFGWGRSEKRGAHDFMDYRLLYFDGRQGFTFGSGQFGICETYGQGSIVANEHQQATPGTPVEMALNGEFPYVVAENPGSKPVDDSNLAGSWPYGWNYNNVDGINWPVSLPNPKQGNMWREWKPMKDVTCWVRTVAVVESGFLIADAVTLDAQGRVDRGVHVGGGLTPQAKFEGSTVPLVPVPGPIGTSAVYRAAQSSTLKGWGASCGYEGGEAGFPRAKTGDTWSFFESMGGVGVTATVLGVPATEVIQVNWLQGSWGNANPFMIARRDNVKDTRFVVFVEPYGTWKKTPDAALARPRLKAMKRLVVTDADGKALSDEQAAAVELDFGDKRVVVLLNDSGKEITAAGLTTTKRFAAGTVK